MALKKQTRLDKIEIAGPFKTIQVRYVTEILENGVVISSSFVRDSFSIERGIEDAPQEIKDIAEVSWTDEIRQAWETHKAENQQPTPE